MRVAAAGPCRCRHRPRPAPVSLGLHLRLALAATCLAWCLLLQQPRPAAAQEMEMSRALLAEQQQQQQGAGLQAAGLQAEGLQAAAQQQQQEGQQADGGSGAAGDTAAGDTASAAAAGVAAGGVQAAAGGAGFGGDPQQGAAADSAAASKPTAAGSSNSTFETYQHYFALCAVTKDNPSDLREWVDYHHALGVTKFYIFDTDQRVPNGPVLQDYIEEGTVEYYHLPRVTPRTIPLMQVRLYYLCLKHVSSRHQFMGFWDVDEFLVLADPSARFPDLLRQYEPFGGLVINWRLMGSSGHVTRPPGGILRNFLQCTPQEYHENHQVKTIVNTRWVYLPSTDPHHFAYNEGRYAVNTAFEKVEGAVNVAIRDELLVLFHYALKSATEYREKMRRGSAMGNYKNLRFFRRIDEASTLTCTQARDACRAWGLQWCAEGAGAGRPASRRIKDALERLEEQQAARAAARAPPDAELEAVAIEALTQRRLAATADAAAAEAQPPPATGITGEQQQQQLGGVEQAQQQRQEQGAELQPAGMAAGAQGQQEPATRGAAEAQAQQPEQQVVQQQQQEVVGVEQVVQQGAAEEAATANQPSIEGGGVATA